MKEKRRECGPVIRGREGDVVQYEEVEKGMWSSMKGMWSSMKG